MIEKVKWHKRLTVRVLFFLTLALVPLGAIGLVQNAELFEASERRKELSLLALTEGAASGERELIQRAFGAAEALGATVESILNDPERCSSNLLRFLESNEEAVYAGFLPVSGISTCSTAGRVIDFSQFPNFQDYVENPRPSVEINLNAPGSGQSVMIVNQPRYTDMGLLGFISISLPLKEVGQAKDYKTKASPILLATVNKEGVVLSTETPRDQALAELPKDIALKNLTQSEAQTFTAENQNGTERMYVMVPVVPDVVYALGAFPAHGESVERLAGPRVNTLLPFLMWAASLLVAWFAIDRLVVTRISELHQNMQRFAKHRTLPALERRGAIAGELQILEESFMRMAQDLLHDEAAQEEQIREKSILLKEVHHRVKNNLQIISSIMNMQIRKANAPETKRALSQVQDRIMGLSGVHRTLYQTENLTQIDAAQLVAKIVEESMAMGTSGDQQVQLTTDLDPMTIFPDQAVPLSMLVAEALTNALKYCGPDKSGQTKICISLKLEDQAHARLCVENSRSVNAKAPNEQALSTGLGQQLIKAFAIQLNGKLDVSTEDESYRISVNFEVEEFKETGIDY